MLLETCWRDARGGNNLEVGKDITGGAKTIIFFVGTESPVEGRKVAGNADHKVFSQVREMLVQQSPRLAALFQGLPAPELEASSSPRGKKRASEGSNGPLSGSTEKQKRTARASSGGGALGLKFDKVHAAEGTWLQKAVDRFDLRAPLDSQVSEAQWKKYYEDREAWERANQEEDEDNEDEDREEEEDEEETLAEIAHRIQKSIRDTLTSTGLNLDPKKAAMGAVLTDWECNDADDDEPRTISSKARFYSPVANVAMWM